MYTYMLSIYLWDTLNMSFDWFSIGNCWVSKDQAKEQLEKKGIQGIQVEIVKLQAFFSYTFLLVNEFLFPFFLLKMRYRRGFLATTTWWARFAAKTESRPWRWLGCFCIWVVVSNITPIWGRFPFSNGLKPPTRYAFVLLISFFFVFRFPQTNIEVAIGSPKNYEIIGTVKAIASCNPWGFSRCYRYQRQVSWRLLPRCPT